MFLWSGYSEGSTAILFEKIVLAFVHLKKKKYGGGGGQGSVNQHGYSRARLRYYLPFHSLAFSTWLSNYHQHNRFSTASRRAPSRSLLCCNRGHICIVNLREISDVSINEKNTKISESLDEVGVKSDRVRRENPREGSASPKAEEAGDG